jgi:hypothetical protein
VAREVVSGSVRGSIAKVPPALGAGRARQHNFRRESDVTNIPRDEPRFMVFESHFDSIGANTVR